MPRADTLERILRASGARLTISPTLRTTALEAAAEIRVALAAGDSSGAFRAWLALNDDLARESATNRVVLTAFAPATTGSALYDAALAALVDYRLTEASAPLPSWVEASTALAEPTVLTDSRYITADDLGAVPEAFQRRGVLIDVDSLQSV